jgi:hypothetical protein
MVTSLAVVLAGRKALPGWRSAAASNDMEKPAAGRFHYFVDNGGHPPIMAH